jgi:hypothetical protein
VIRPFLRSRADTPVSDAALFNRRPQQLRHAATRSAVLGFPRRRRDRQMAWWWPLRLSRGPLLQARPSSPLSC